SGGGHVTRADMFGGELTNAEVSIDIRDGSLSAAYAGQIANVNPAAALDDRRNDAYLTGSGTARISVNDLLIRTPELDDHEITSTINLEESRRRTMQLTSATMTSTLNGSTLTVDEFHGIGPAIDLQAVGRVEFDGQRSSQLDYTVNRADLTLFKEYVGEELSGGIVSKGQLTGPLGRFRLRGSGNATRVEAPGI